MTIDLVVVEAHQHVLEHIHFILRHRARKVKDAGRQISWSMLHWDSHPDLACPHEGIPAAACFLPRKTWPCNKTESGENQEKNLYDLLDTSEGGIAEWILPLVLAGGLNRVIWMKNPWCSQFSKGHHYFYVGVEIPDEEKINVVASFLDLPEKSVVKSSLMLPYYIDDNSHVNEEELHLKQSLELFVLETDDISKENCGPCPNPSSSPTDWILDVCLDYFMCSNPFLEDLNDLDESVWELLKKAVTETSFRRAIHGQKILNKEQAAMYSRFFMDFDAAVHNLLNYIFDNDRDYTTDLNDQSFEDKISRLQEFYSDFSLGRSYWTNFITAVYKIKKVQSHTPQQLLLIMSKAMRNISLPHGHGTEDLCKEEIYLPEYLLEKIRLFGDCLRREDWMREVLNLKAHPMIITVARSSDDGYTPSYVVENLQNAVLHEIHSVYCGCSEQGTGDCAIRLTLDYGLNEGSSLEAISFRNS